MSNKKISIHDMEKSNLEFKKSHYVSVSGFDPQTEKVPKWFQKFYKDEFKPLQQAVVNMQTKPPKYFLEFQKQMLDFQKQMLDFVQEQRQFNKLIMSRIDNLVSKNNLKE